MKTNTSSSHSPASASSRSPAFESGSGEPSSLPAATARDPETKPSLPDGRARSRLSGHGPGHGHGSRTNHGPADAAARSLASRTDPLGRSSFSDASLVPPVLTSDLRAGIVLCRRARLVLQAAAVRSFDAGGMELDPVHLRLLLDCAQMCETAADFMSRNSPYHLYLCEVCAAICEACAESCALAGEMEECAAICQECIGVCRALAG